MEKQGAWGKMPHDGECDTFSQALERKMQERDSLAKLIVPDMAQPMSEEDYPEPGSFDGPQSYEDYGYLPQKEKK